MKHLEICLLGRLNLILDGDPLPRLGTQKARALLAYLVMHPGQMLAREQMAALLWGGFPEERARHNLRQAIHNLRRKLAPYLIVDPDSITFDAESNYWLDVDQFSDLSTKSSIEHLTKAINLYQGEFLAGLVVKDSQAFDEWLFFERDRLERQYLFALSQLSDALAADREMSLAIEYAKLLVSHDPLQEQAQRQLMRLYNQSGDRNAALLQYQHCKDVLQKELGVKPEPETIALYHRILQSDTTVDQSLLLDAQSRYRLGEILDRGSSGIVRTAHDTLLNRPVTLKLLTSVTDNPPAARQLLDAASHLARLAHPNIASIYDAGYLGETPYVALQPALGTPLSKHAPLPLTNLLDAMEQVSSALAHAHLHGVYHGDVRPANIFISDDGMVQIVGFTMVPPHIGPEISLKDAAYLPPELAQGQQPDHRADLYSLGVTLYELVTGQLPFSGQTPLAIISQHVNVPPVPPRSRRPNIPPELEALILKLLAKRPQDRYDTAQKVGKDLGPIRHQLEGQALIEQTTAPAGAAPGASLLDRITRGRLIGRERELEELKAHWQRTIEGNHHLILLSGELGIGKTRLVRELMVYARLQNATILWGRCYEQEVAVPYRPFIDAFRDYIADQTKETLQRQLGTSAAEMVRLLPTLSDRLGPIAPNPALNPQEERIRLFDHITAFVRAIATERPTLLFLDDLHWADKASLMLLQHLTRHVYDLPLLTLGAYQETKLTRKHPLQQMLVELNQERLATRLHLRRLDRRAVGDMIQAMCDVEITPAVIDAIYEETEGNPFFVEEVIKAMVEEDMFDPERMPRTEQDWIAAHIPQSINATISQRLERISPESITLLTQAAVIGRQFPLDLLLAVTNQDETTALNGLEEAVAAQLVRPPRPGTGQVYTFQHPLVAQTLYDELNTRRRARLHGRVGQAIEKIYAKHRENWLEELAHHFAQAYGEENEEKAITYNIQAGDRARQIHAHEGAIRYYKMALELLEDMPRDLCQGRVWEAIGDIRYLTGHYNSALAAYQRALQFLEQISRRVVVERKMSLVHARHGDYAQALQHLEKAQLSLYKMEKDDASQERALIWASQADIYFRLGQLARAREACLAGLEKLKGLSHYPQSTFLHRTLGSIALREGKTKEALQHHRQSLDMARQANDAEGIIAALANLTMANRHAGDWQEAITLGQKALDLAEKVDNYRGMSFAHFGLGTTFWRLGELDQALYHTTQSLQIAEKIQERNQIAQTHAYLAIITLDIDSTDFSQAQEHADQARDIGKELGSSALLALVRVVQAEIYLRQKDWSQALSGLGQATEMDDVAPWLKADFFRALALAHLGQGNIDTALNHARQALETATAHEYPYEIATAEQALAQALHQNGQTGTAAEHLGSAIAKLETLGSKRQLKRAQEHYRQIKHSTADKRR